jgi:hypothetical protein
MKRSDEYSVDLGAGTAYAVRGETSGPRPDFIGGDSPDQQEEYRQELYAVLDESALALKSLTGKP